MGLPDSFDPTMMLNEAKSMGDTAVPAQAPGAERQPGDVMRNDPTANLGSFYATVEISGGGEKPLSPSGAQRQPADVDRFNGGV